MHDISWFFLLLYAFLYSVKSTSEVMYVMFIIFRIKDIAAYPTVQSGVRVMVFNTTFNNISVISWRSVLLMEETGENH
jgi:hypothetical protein